MGGLGFTVLRWRTFSSDSTHLPPPGEKGSAFVASPGTKCRPATTRLEGWVASARPPGALGLGHWPRVPKGSYSHLGLCRPPRSLILGGRALA